MMSNLSFLVGLFLFVCSILGIRGQCVNSTCCLTLINSGQESIIDYICVPGDANNCPAGQGVIIYLAWTVGGCEDCLNPSSTKVTHTENELLQKVKDNGGEIYDPKLGKLTTENKNESENKIDVNEDYDPDTCSYTCCIINYANGFIGYTEAICTTTANDCQSDYHTGVLGVFPTANCKQCFQ